MSREDDSTIKGIIAEIITQIRAGGVWQGASQDIAIVDLPYVRIALERGDEVSQDIAIVDCILNEVVPRTPERVRLVMDTLGGHEKGERNFVEMINERAIILDSKPWIEMLIKTNPANLFDVAITTPKFMELATLALGLDREQVWEFAKPAIRMVENNSAFSFRSMIVIERLMTDHEWLAEKLSVKQENTLLLHPQTTQRRLDGIVSAINRKRLMGVARHGTTQMRGSKQPKL